MPPSYGKIIIIIIIFIFILVVVAILVFVGGGSDDEYNYDYDIENYINLPRFDKETRRNDAKKEREKMAY